MLVSNRAWASRVRASFLLLASGLFFADSVISAGWPSWPFIIGFGAAGNGAVFTPLAILGWRDDRRRSRKP